MKRKSQNVHEIEMPAHQIGNWAWTRLQDLMDGGLANRERIDPADVSEAETLLMIKRAISEKADVIAIKLSYENKPSTTND